MPDGGSLRSRRLLAVCLGMALAATAGRVSAASRDSDPYGWQDYTRQLRQEESRRIDRMLDNTYGPNARSASPDLRPLANSLNNLFTSLAEAKRQRAEEKDAQARFLMRRREDISMPCPMRRTWRWTVRVSLLRIGRKPCGS